MFSCERWSSQLGRMVSMIMLAWWNIVISICTKSEALPGIEPGLQELDEIRILSDNRYTTAP